MTFPRCHKCRVAMYPTYGVVPIFKCLLCDREIPRSYVASSPPSRER